MKTIEDLRRIIDKDKPKEVIDLFIREILESLQYERWLDSMKRVYESQFPEKDESGSPIEYSENPDDENYKPPFDEWLSNQEPFVYSDDAVTEEDLKPIKVELLRWLKKQFLKAQEHSIMDSSVGFPIDVNDTALRNVSALIDFLENDTDTVQFRDANNEFHEVTKTDLVTMKKEMVAFGLQLYQKKWALEQAIANAKSRMDLIAIKW